MKTQIIDSLAHYENTILDAINENSEGESITLTSDKINYGRERFASEFQWSVKRHGKLQSLTDWLQGLALNVPYNNHEVLENAKNAGIFHGEGREGAEDDFLEMYWRKLALACIRLGF
jgi:hypothetical protein